MIQTTVRPQKESFDMQVTLPIDYVGKEVHVLFYVDEEVKQITDLYSRDKINQLKQAANDSLFLTDVQEIEADFQNQ